MALNIYARKGDALSEIANSPKSARRPEDIRRALTKRRRVEESPSPRGPRVSRSRRGSRSRRHAAARAVESAADPGMVRPSDHQAEVDAARRLSHASND